MFERQHLTRHCLFSKPLKYWLVVSNKCYCPFHIWDVILITHWLSYFSEGWVYHQPEYDINFAESWALRVERVRTGSEMRHLLDESSIFHGFLMVTWKNSHGCGKKNAIKVDHVLWVSWSFMEIFMVFPHLALKNHHIFRSIPMCVTDFTGPATFPRCPGRNHGPSPRVRFVRWSPRALPGGDSWIDAATKCGSFPMKKVDLPIKTVEINHDLPWFTMIFPSKSIQMVEINYDLPSKIASFTANNEESCGFPHEKWWFFQQTCRCA